LLLAKERNFHHHLSAVVTRWESRVSWVVPDNPQLNVISRYNQPRVWRNTRCEPKLIWRGNTSKIVPGLLRVLVGTVPFGVPTLDPAPAPILESSLELPFRGAVQHRSDSAEISAVSLYLRPFNWIFVFGNRKKSHMLRLGAVALLSVRNCSTWPFKLQCAVCLCVVRHPPWNAILLIHRLAT
jgi:hypothetical protein